MMKKIPTVSAIAILFFFTNFYAAAQTSMNLDAAIQSTARDIESRLPQGASLAMVNFVSGSPALSDYVIEELAMGLMESGNIFVIDHNTLNRALVNAEIDLQLSGNVSDASMVSVGKLIGAGHTLSGSLSGSGNSFRFEVFLTDTKTQRRQSLGAKNVQRNERLTALMNQRSKPEPKIPDKPLTALEFLKRADVYIEMGEDAKAAADYTEALKFNNQIGKHFYTPYIRGTLYKNLDRYDESIADFTLAINRNGEFSLAFIGRGFAYMAIRDFEKAFADFNRAVQLTPNQPDPYNFRSAVYTLRGEYDKAIADCLYSINLNPDYAASYKFLCLAYMENGELEKAEDANRTSLRLAPGNKIALTNMDMLCSKYIERGIAFGTRGNHSAAIADFTRAIGVVPASAQGFANRGMGYYNLGELNKAVADLELAVKYSPADTQYKSALDRIRRQRDLEAAWGN